MHVTPHSAGALFLSALLIATLHALIPSHWLVFALVGKSQRWTLKRTLRITALAGLGHILSTVLLGVIVAAAGKYVWGLDNIPERFAHSLTAAVLIAMGAAFFISGVRGRHGCLHTHHIHQQEAEVCEDHVHDSHPEHHLRSVTTIGALLLGLTLSPCLDLLSIYLAASQSSWAVIIGISGVMALVTLTIMLALVAGARLGLERMRLRWLEEYEGITIGVTLIILGTLLFFV